MSTFDQFSQDYRAILDRNIDFTGEGSEYFAAYKASFVAAQIKPQQNCRILDYGCGVGLVSAQVKKLMPWARVDGFEVSPRSLDQVDKTLKAHGTFTCEPHKLGTHYNVIIIANVLHHVSVARRQDVVSKAADLLAPEGKLIIFEHNPSNPFTCRAVLSCPFDEDAILLPPGETLSYLAQAGIRENRLKYIVFFPHFLRWFRFLEAYLDWCFLGAQYAVIACQGASEAKRRAECGCEPPHASQFRRGGIRRFNEFKYC